MPLNDYGVLKGYVVDTKDATGSSPHYQIRMVDSKDDWRIAVNTRSQASPSEVLYFVNEQFEHPLCDEFAKLPVGFTGKRENPAVGRFHPQQHSQGQ